MEASGVIGFVFLIEIEQRSKFRSTVKDKIGSDRRVESKPRFVDSNKESRIKEGGSWRMWIRLDCRQTQWQKSASEAWGKSSQTLNLLKNEVDSGLPESKEWSVTSQEKEREREFEGDGGRNKCEFKSYRIRLLLSSIYTGSKVDFTHGTCDLPNYYKRCSTTSWEYELTNRRPIGGRRSIEGNSEQTFRVRLMRVHWNRTWKQKARRIRRRNPILE